MNWKHLRVVIFLGYAVAVFCLDVVGVWNYRGSIRLEHGWPFVYMQRSGVYVPSIPSPFTDDLDAIMAHRLPFDGATVLEFSVWRLVADLVVATGGGILVVCGVRNLASRQFQGN